MTGITRMLRPISIPAAVFLALLAAGASEAEPPHASEGCGGKPHLAPGGSAVRTIQVGELLREYRLHLPAGYDTAKPFPLVLAFHGYTTTADQFENEYSSFSEHADEHDYVVVYPQATAFEAGGATITSWNDLACNASPGPEGPICTDTAFDYPTPPECDEPSECDWCSCHDDIGFVAALLDEIEKTLCIDLDHVYAHGMSNGAMFVHRLGCEMPERFAAIAPVGGTLAKGFNCAPGPSPKISMINIHGTRDTTVPFDGTPASDGFLYTPAAQVLMLWAGDGSQNCASETSPYPTSSDGVVGFRCQQHADCATGAEIVGCGWDGGHDWPHEGDDQYSVDVIWEFFEKNGR